MNLKMQAAATTRYRPEIDGLRAIAVLSVIVNHFSKSLLPSGFLGVDIFFVISGFVITASLISRQEASLGSFLASFYARRIRRIMPALIVCVLLTSIVLTAVNRFPGLSLRTGLAALLGMSNLYLYSLSTDYFSPSSELNAFTQTWSLGVEEQFYFIFPLLFWVSGISRRHGKAGKNWLLAMISCLSLLSFVGFYWHFAVNVNASYFLSPWRFWELGAGVLLAVLVAHRSVSSDKEPNSKVGLLSLLFLILILCFLFLPQAHASLTTPGIVLCTTLLLSMIHKNRSSFVYQSLTFKPLLWIGLASYSLYLWHWSVIVISRWTTGIHSWTLPFQIATIIALSFLSYNYIEKPFRASRWSASSYKAIRAGILSTVMGCGLIVLISWLPGELLFLGDKHRPKPVSQPALNTPYRVEAYDSSVGGWPADPCLLMSNQDSNKKIDLDACLIEQVVAKRPRILVIGDSYAASLVSAFDGIIQRDRLPVSLTSSWGASPVPEVPNVSSWSKANAAYWQRIVPSLVSQLNAGDIVLIVSDLSSFSPASQDGESRFRINQLRKGLLRFSADLEARGVRLAMLSATPLTREAFCLPDVDQGEWFNGFGGPCNFLTKEQTLARTLPLRTMLQ